MFKDFEIPIVPRRLVGTAGAGLKTAFMAIGIALASAGIVQAASIDFTDGVFTPLGVDATTGVPATITEEAEGVTFTIAPNVGESGVDITDDGLRFASFSSVPMSAVSIVADKAVRLTSITGIALPSFSVDYSAPSYGPFTIGYATILSEVELSGGGFDLDPGQVFFIDASKFFLSDAQGLISAIGFDVLDTVTPPAVPLPAGFPLLFAGLGSLYVLRKRMS